MQNKRKNPLRARRAYQMLRDAIVTGKKLPGSRLIPVDLEEELNIGRVPIREALLELGQTGLVVSEPYRGAVVAQPPTMEEIQEIFEIRYLLEGKAAEAAAANVSDELVSELERLHSEMSAHPDSDMPYFQINRQFHMTLYRESELNYLCLIIKQLIDKVMTFRIRYPFELRDYRRFNRGHQQIIDYLKQGDVKNLKAITVANVRSGFETLVKAYDKVIPRTKG